MERLLQQRELRWWIDQESSFPYWSWLLLAWWVFDTHLVLHYLLLSARPFSRGPLDLAALDQQLLLFFRCVLDVTCVSTSVAVGLWIVVEWCACVSLEIAYWRGMGTWNSMLVLLVWWRRQAWALRSTLCCRPASDTWGTLTRLREGLLLGDDLKLSHWAESRVDIRLVDCLGWLHEPNHFTTSTSVVDDGMVDQGVLVVEVHVRLTTLWRLDGLARPIYLIKKRVLLLTAIWIASLDLKRLLGARSRSVVELFTFTGVSVALHHLIILILTYDSDNQIASRSIGALLSRLCALLLAIILCEIHLLMLNEAAVVMATITLHFVTLSCVEAWLIHHLIETGWVQGFVSTDIATNDGHRL